MVQMLKNFFRNESVDYGQWVFSFKRSSGTIRERFAGASIGNTKSDMMACLGSQYAYWQIFCWKLHGQCKNLQQVVDVIIILFHCQTEENCVFPSNHTTVDDHNTLCDVAKACGSRLISQLKYLKLISHHNQKKHWVHNSTIFNMILCALRLWRTK